jgi:puromycin-sensitive aminopeptidase
MTELSTGSRLPGTVEPIRYEITIAPDLETFSFQGQETVDLKILQTTDTIKLNAADLNVRSGSLLMNGRTIDSTNIDLDHEQETVTFSFNESLPIGEYTLVTEFDGTLNDQLKGFYRSQYLDDSGQTCYLATTQFEATDARRAFPCWDEPAFKAIFEIRLVIPPQLTALSNMPIESENMDTDGRRVVKFAPSPQMSTYLVAMLVGDFACVEGITDDGTVIRVWATKGKEQQGHFALANSIKLLRYLNDYFGIPYPLPKLDHIAVPDFAAGAMENWGAITYRETALLFDPVNSATQSRQRIMEVVAHEMAHMWFGDLVTMEWWDDLWLNESFASWMGDKAVDHLYPEWQMWSQFVSHDTNSALGLDGLRNSHPIEQEVGHPSEIRELFDAISYSKGGSVLRMLETFLGPDVFRDGLREYIASYQYGNARTEHLWGALAKVSGQPVTVVMDSWIKQVGYPFLQVIPTEDSNAGIGLELRQRRFLYDHLDTDVGLEENLTWHVPVNITGEQDSAETSFLMSDERLAVIIPGRLDHLSKPWIKVNAKQTGFYRVNYDETGWQRLAEAIQANDIGDIDRLGLQNDAYALVRAGYLPATVFLSFVKSYANEVDAVVWGDLSANLRGLHGLLWDEECLSLYERFAGRLYGSIAAEVGWNPKPGEGHLDSILRSVVLGQYGSYGDIGTVDEAKRLFGEFLKDPDKLHPDLRGVVFGLVAQAGGKDTFDALWKAQEETSLHEEKVRILISMSRFREKSLLTQLLERSLTDAVRSQDTVSVVTAVSANRRGRDLAWEFVKGNWSEFDRRYGKGGFGIMRLVSITGTFTEQSMEEEVEEFFRTHPAPGASRTILQALERIRLNFKWLALNRGSINAWLNAEPN